MSKTPTNPITGRAISSYTLQHVGGRTIEIGSQPMVIGSGPRCTFRLDAPGTKPVHCVVSLGEEGPVARRWAEGTLLNEESFTEALLTEGDRLSIGSVHFEVHCEDEIAHLDDLLDEWELLEEEEETPESGIGYTVEATEASITESQPDVEDWLGGKSEWTWPSEMDSSPEACEDEVVVDETEHTELEEEARAADPWGIELASIAELSSEELASDEQDWLNFFAKEPPEGVLAIGNADLTEEANNVDSVDALRVVALRTRLAIRAERLRSIVETLRGERVQTGRQTTQSLAAIEQLQADLANAQQQASEGVVSLVTLQEELATASEWIETLEAELRDVIEASAAAAEEKAIEETQEAEATFVEELPSAEEKLAVEDAIQNAVEEEAPVWPELTDVAENETSPDTFEPMPEADPGSIVEVPGEAEVNAAEDLWGIESLASETTCEETSSSDLSSGEESAYDHVKETPSEESFEQPAEELIVSLDKVLLPGETLEDSPAEAVDEPFVGAAAEAIATEAEGGGNSVLASLMTTNSSEETEEQATGHVEPESFIDRYAQMLPEDSEEETLDDSIAPSLPVSVEPEPTTSVEHDHENDESLDDYMKKMMDRIRGDEAPVAMAPKVSQPVQVKAAPNPAPVSQEPEAPQSEEVPLLNLNEMKRKPTRALGADLGELRQLANQSARRAINVAETNDRKENATSRLVISGALATCGLLACLTTPSLLSWQLYGGLAGIAAGGYLGYRTLRLIQRSAALQATPIHTVEDEETAEV